MTSKLMTHNINGATGGYRKKRDDIEADGVKAEYQQVFDSALLAGLEKSKGMRVPKLPRKSAAKQAEEAAAASGPEILPQTYEK